MDSTLRQAQGRQEPFAILEGPLVLSEHSESKGHHERRECSM